MYFFKFAVRRKTNTCQQKKLTKCAKINIKFANDMEIMVLLK